LFLFTCLLVCSFVNVSVCAILTPLAAAVVFLLLLLLFFFAAVPARPHRAHVSALLAHPPAFSAQLAHPDLRRSVRNLGRREAEMLAARWAAEGHGLELSGGHMRTHTHFVLHFFFFFFFLWQSIPFSRVFLLLLRSRPHFLFFVYWGKSVGFRNDSCESFAFRASAS
jgi:hypothetical protein